MAGEIRHTADARSAARHGGAPGRGIGRGIGRLPRGLLVLVLAWSLAAFTPARPPLDAAMVERAVGGAEWLAERAEAAPAGDGTQSPAGLIDWLLTPGGAIDAEHEAFIARLGALGYREPRLALSRWLDELSRVLAAAEAARRVPALRPAAEIQAELRTLPTVPLDAEGAAERDRLVEELALASVPAGARAAAAAAAGRIAALKVRAGIGGGP